MRVIGEDAFSGCKHLTTVSFNSGLKHIFDNAFNGCALLLEIILPNSLSLLDVLVDVSLYHGLNCRRN